MHAFRRQLKAASAAMSAVAEAIVIDDFVDADEDLFVEISPAMAPPGLTTFKTVPR